MIPNVAHFVWLGKTFPWVYGLALKSAALRGGFHKVVLHHTDDIRHTSGWRAAADMDRIVTRRISAKEYLLQIGAMGKKLWRLYRSLEQPAAKSNILRVAILTVEGGVYLDTDIITVRPFLPLLDTGFFCGKERIALPANLLRSRMPHRWLAAIVRIAVRDILRRLPSGWRLFKRIERAYPAVVNNAVLGAHAHHPLLIEMLQRMVAMPRRRQQLRYALGTHLLEEMVDRYQGDDVTLHPPLRFYPLGPEISAHWFRHHKDATVTDVIEQNTICVHWYASVRIGKHLPLIDGDFVAHHCHGQLFSGLAMASMEQAEGKGV